MIYIHNELTKEDFINLYNNADDDTKALIESLLTDAQLLP